MEEWPRPGRREEGGGAKTGGKKGRRTERQATDVILQSCLTSSILSCRKTKPACPFLSEGEGGEAEDGVMRRELPEEESCLACLCVIA
eukprot:748828-Hanusia_phi.AAC.1